MTNCVIDRSRWPHILRRGSTASRSLGLRIRIPPGTWRSVSSDCCILLGRGLCDGSITRSEESYREWSSECDPGTTLRSAWPAGAVEPRGKRNFHFQLLTFLFLELSVFVNCLHVVNNFVKRLTNTIARQPTNFTHT